MGVKSYIAGMQSDAVNNAVNIGFGALQLGANHAKEQERLKQAKDIADMNREQVGLSSSLGEFLNELQYDREFDRYELKLDEHIQILTGRIEANEHLSEEAKAKLSQERLPILREEALGKTKVLAKNGLMAEIDVEVAGYEEILTGNHSLTLEQATSAYRSHLENLEVYSPGTIKKKVEEFSYATAPTKALQILMGEYQKSYADPSYSMQARTGGISKDLGLDFRQEQALKKSASVFQQQFDKNVDDQINEQNTIFLGQIAQAYDRGLLFDVEAINGLLEQVPARNRLVLYKTKNTAVANNDNLMVESVKRHLADGGLFSPNDWRALDAIHDPAKRDEVEQLSMLNTGMSVLSSGGSIVDARNALEDNDLPVSDWTRIEAKAKLTKEYLSQESDVSRIASDLMDSVGYGEAPKTVLYDTVASQIPMEQYESLVQEGTDSVPPIDRKEVDSRGDEYLWDYYSQIKEFLAKSPSLQLPRAGLSFSYEALPSVNTQEEASMVEQVATIVHEVEQLAVEMDGGAILDSIEQVVEIDEDEEATLEVEEAKLTDEDMRWLVDSLKDIRRKITQRFARTGSTKADEPLPVLKEPAGNTDFDTQEIVEDIRQVLDSVEKKTAARLLDAVRQALQMMKSQGGDGQTNATKGKGGVFGIPPVPTDDGAGMGQATGKVSEAVAKEVLIKQMESIGIPVDESPFVEELLGPDLDNVSAFVEDGAIPERIVPETTVGEDSARMDRHNYIRTLEDDRMWDVFGYEKKVVQRRDELERERESFNERLEEQAATVQRKAAIQHKEEAQQYSRPPLQRGMAQEALVSNMLQIIKNGDGRYISTTELALIRDDMLRQELSVLASIRDSFSIDSPLALDFVDQLRRDPNVPDSTLPQVVRDFVDKGFIRAETAEKNNLARKYSFGTSSNTDGLKTFINDTVSAVYPAGNGELYGMKRTYLKERLSQAAEKAISMNPDLIGKDFALLQKQIESFAVSQVSSNVLTQMDSLSKLFAEKDISRRIDNLERSGVSTFMQDVEDGRYDLLINYDFVQRPEMRSSRHDSAAVILDKVTGELTPYRTYAELGLTGTYFEKLQVMANANFILAGGALEQALTGSFGIKPKDMKVAGKQWAFSDPQAEGLYFIATDTDAMSRGTLGWGMCTGDYDGISGFIMFNDYVDPKLSYDIAELERRINDPLFANNKVVAEQTRNQSPLGMGGLGYSPVRVQKQVDDAYYGVLEEFGKKTKELEDLIHDIMTYRYNLLGMPAASLPKRL